MADAELRMRAMMPTYFWNDEGPEDGLTVSIAVPTTITKQNVDISITSTTIKAGLKGAKPIVQGTFFQRVNADDCMWQIDRKMGLLTINLEREAFMGPWPLLISGATPGKQIDPQSLFYIGNMHEIGGLDMFEQSCEKAIENYTKAAEGGNIPSMIRLAEIHTPKIEGEILGGPELYDPTGNSAVKDGEKAFDLYIRAAQAGSSWAQSMVGLACVHPSALGMQRPPQPEEARVWVEKAAAQGCQKGMFLMGLLYEEGIGGAQPDFVKAAEWYKKAGTYANAMHNLAWLQLRGVGKVGSNTEAAMALLEQAHKLDSRLAVPNKEQIRKVAKVHKLGGGVLDNNLEIAGVVLGVLAVGVAYYFYTRRSS